MWDLPNLVLIGWILLLEVFALANFLKVLSWNLIGVVLHLGALEIVPGSFRLNLVRHLSLLVPRALHLQLFKLRHKGFGPALLRATLIRDAIVAHDAFHLVLRLELAMGQDQPFLLLTGGVIQPGVALCLLLGRLLELHYLLQSCAVEVGCLPALVRFGSVYLLPGFQIILPDILSVLGLDLLIRLFRPELLSRRVDLPLLGMHIAVVIAEVLQEILRKLVVALVL